MQKSAHDLFICAFHSYLYVLQQLLLLAGNTLSYIMVIQNKKYLF